MSENIFSNFYNKVLSFFQKDENKGGNTKEIASNRLKLVLMQDRTNLDTLTMQKMREQIITVISKYVEIDKEALDLNLEADGEEIALMLNIPVIRARTKEEIEALEEKEAKAAAEEKAEQSTRDVQDTEESEESCDSDNETADTVESEKKYEQDALEENTVLEEETESQTKQETIESVELEQKDENSNNSSTNEINDAEPDIVNADCDSGKKKSKKQKDK